ncbi:MAG: AAA family ATPase [Candidatus Altiarchaeota archaeon]|nr:AAA family ATPase [Candidatus Altiarchaeota archaeon]
MIDELLKNELGDRKIFKDKTILSPHYVPSELPHRDKEIKGVTQIIGPALRNEKTSNLFIYGGPGTGKTCVVKYVIRKIQEFLNKPEMVDEGILVKVAYMNCKIRNSKYQVLLKTLEDDALNDEKLMDAPLKGRSEPSLKGMDPADLYDRLFRVVEKNNMNLIIALDEIDMVKKGLNDLMYILTRINDELGAGHVSVVGISNDRRVKNRLDPRSKSTLCEEEMIFPHYNAVQLRTILNQRVEEGFQPTAIDDSMIRKIAAFAAQDGDARYALKLLKKAGEIAQNENKNAVDMEDVEYARNLVEKDIMTESITLLPEHQQIVIYSIASLAVDGGMYKRLSGRGTGDLLTGEVYEAYEANCKALNRNPRTMRQFSEYLNELEMSGLIAMRLSGKGIRGTTRLIRLGYPPNEIKRIVSKSLGLGSD